MENKYYIYDDIDASTKEYDTIVYNYGSFGTTAQISNICKAIFSCMKTKYGKKFQVEEKSKLFNFKRKLVA